MQQESSKKAANKQQKYLASKMRWDVRQRLEITKIPKMKSDTRGKMIQRSSSNGSTTLQFEKMCGFKHLWDRKPQFLIISPFFNLFFFNSNWNFISLRWQNSYHYSCFYNFVRKCFLGRYAGYIASSVYVGWILCGYVIIV